MYQHLSTSLMLAEAHERELLRMAKNSRMARQNASGDVTPASRTSHQMAAVLVALLVVLGALALV